MAAAPSSQSQFGFFLHLLAEVHDCHLMGAPQFKISCEPAKGPVAFVLSWQFEIQIVVSLPDLCVRVLGMNHLLLFSENRNYR